MANGLLTLQTDLKSLRYGSDKPYITKDVNDPPSSNQTGMQITKRIDDTSRIAQMLIDRPGLKYLGNEALLQQVNVGDRIRKAKDKGKSTVGAVLQQAGNTLVSTAKIAGSTLAQVPVNGTGTHFLKGFRTDTYLRPDPEGVQPSGFAAFFGAGGVEGAPYALSGKEIPMHINSDMYDEKTDQLINTSSLGYDEKVNIPIPQGENRIYSSQGTNIIEDNEGQEGWKPWTSLSVTSSLVSREDTNLLKDSKYDSDDTKSKDKQSRYLVEGGAPVPVGPIQEFANGNPQQNQTTAKSGSLNSLPNTGDYTDLIASKDTVQSIAASALQLGNKYKDRSTFTGVNTQDSINSVAAGTPIKVSKQAGIRNTTLASGSMPGGSLPNSGEYVAPIAETTVPSSNKYTEGATYTGTDTQSNINSANAGGFITVTDKVDTEQTYKVKGSKPLSGKGDSKVVDENSVNRNVSDFRTGPTSFEYNNSKINKETRINLGNQGKNIGKVSYSTIDRDKIDELNALDVSETRIDGTNAARDLAKFYFEIITPDNVTDNDGTFLHFRAHIDSIDDSYSGDWDSHQYVGRAEEFFTYKGFKRDISVGFKISAQSRAEMKPLYKKMVYLASVTAPTYGGGSNFMRGTLVKLSIGSYFSQIPGIITSVKYTWNPDYMWEIAMQNPEGGVDDDQQELPMTLDCSITFKPIHNFAPQTGLHHYFTSKKPLNGSDPFF
ncbi:hypothetical protein immuto35A_235 [Flavobacterium phage vB_FspM_immuto_3-5A]|jgi:hypothetical protein|uniref:Uncharacterized protein n=1 Tax=Flavobacterium phage vB_FspM_immuto_2-6A TaxID=2801477 RepID=A0A7T8ERR9_9CAUD|nr:hypothetical protein KNV73_gp035 [Flavobacterium phage vB_FspM_immuto_2-6A]QQO91915.1 hypothetical protein immuto26A_236 [Flavobacterium phage vB_FspM_immuto_2-6A]QQO92153.1 hypothetical protein immuto35A_235 [Flavobacterium phage vB_FspM_immuto_3-5A]QQO92391.1 hypothetical protein immuto136C_235 [Flavobacterium phage vB_FspM_immuto_13-6C]